MNAIVALVLLVLLPITVYTQMLKQNEIGKNQRANKTISIAHQYGLSMLHTVWAASHTFTVYFWLLLSLRLIFVLCFSFAYVYVSIAGAGLLLLLPILSVRLLNSFSWKSAIWRDCFIWRFGAYTHTHTA